MMFSLIKNESVGIEDYPDTVAVNAMMCATLVNVLTSHDVHHERMHGHAHVALRGARGCVQQYMS